MESDSEAAEALPVRRRRTRTGGRHRGKQSLVLPSDAPPVILAVPGEAGSSPAGIHAARVAAETMGLIDALETGADVRVGHLHAADDDPTSLRSVLGRLSAGDPDSSAATPAPPAAVVIPLVTGPHPRTDAIVRRAVEAADASVAVAEQLGPHPLLAEVLHVRLAGAGLARADRVRLVGITTAADGIVLATVGGEQAARVADATAVLLAARLAVPVIPAALDGAPDVAAAADRLRQIGASRLAVAPYILGPEWNADRLAASAAEINAEVAEPLGAHPAIAQLIIDRYTDAMLAIGVTDETGPPR